jgi:rod shape-determining protein MreD
MIIFNFIIQATVLQHFRIAGILPNTALIIVVTISILYGRKKGILTSFIAGFLQDLFFSKGIGINILIYLSIAYLIGGVENRVFKDNYLTPFLLICLSTFFYHSVYFVLMHFLRHPVNYLFVLKTIVLGETIYNSILGIIFYRIFYNQVYYR